MSAVTLRAIAREDVAWLDGWLAGAARSGGYSEIEDGRPGAGLLARLSRERSLRASIIAYEDRDAGVVVYRLRATKSAGTAVIELVATPREESRRGAGMFGAEALERELRDHGVRTIYAPAAESHGIAVYFWIRLGYRPLLRAEWPCERAGVVWLSREVRGAR